MKSPFTWWVFNCQVGLGSQVSHSFYNQTYYVYKTPSQTQSLTKNASQTSFDFSLVVSMSLLAISCLNSWCFALNPNPLFCFFS